MSATTTTTGERAWEEWVYEPWTCEICNLKTTVGYRTKHLKTKKHLANAEKKPQQLSQVMTPMVEETKMVNCDICHILYNPVYRSQHIRSKSHQEKLDGLATRKRKAVEIEPEEHIEDSDVSDDDEFDLSRLVNRFHKC